MNAAAMTFRFLQERFVAGLERRLGLMNDCLSVLRTGAGDQHKALDDMMRAFHSLAGIGGTYGFSSITSIAREGELTCRSLEGQVDRAGLEALGDVVTALSAAASWAASDTGCPELQAAS